MALSGSFSNNRGSFLYRIDWAASQSIEDNISVVVCTHKLVISSGASLYIGSRYNTCTLGGVTRSFTSPAISASGAATTIILGTTTHNVAHDSNGAGSFNCSSTFSIEATISGTYVSGITTTGSATLDTIPRKATIVSAPNFNDEQSPTITYSNAAGNGVTSLEACISLTGTAADVPYRAISKTGSSYTFNLTETERNTLRAAVESGSSRAVRFVIRTVIGGVTYTDELNKTFTLINHKPTVSVTVADTNAKTLALTGDSSKYIKGFSNAAYTITAAARKTASIKSYTAVCGSKSSTAASGTFGAVDSAAFSFSVTDSRDEVVTKDVNGTLISYIPLTCNMLVGNPTVGGDGDISISGNFFNGSFGAVSNSLTVEYRYKKGSDAYSDWIEATPTKSSGTYSGSFGYIIADFDYQSAYTFQARAVDKLLTVESAERTVIAIPVFDWSKDDFNFNTSTISAKNNTLIRVTEDGKVVISASEADMYFRPNGTSNDAGQLRIKPNGDLVINGSTLADYVVSQGVTSGWTWRKWSSGLAECWRTIDYTGLSIAKQWGSFYISASTFQVSFPFAFSAIPVCTYSVESNYSCWIMPSGSDFTSIDSTCSMQLCRGTSVSANVDVSIKCHAFGRWK